MAEEPQPSAIQEGASDPPAPTGTAEDRKAAAALSSLDAHDDDAASKKNVDTKALGEAMKSLSVQDTGAAEKKKTVKIEAKDVSLLVCSKQDGACANSWARVRGFQTWTCANHVCCRSRNLNFRSKKLPNSSAHTMATS